MSTKKERNFEIVNGPSKDMLFDACKYAYSKTAKVVVEFSVAVGYTTPRDNPSCAYVPMNIRDMIISGIEHEDGSGESLNIHGYCRAALGVATYELKPYEFTAYYDTKKRNGTMTFCEN